MSEEETKMKFVKEEELKGTNETLGRWGEKFQVIVTSDFQLEDYQEFLENSVPLDMLKVYNVKMDSWIMINPAASFGSRLSALIVRIWIRK